MSQTVRAINYAEQNLFADPPRIVALAAATATEIIPDQVADRSGEIAYRYIQNVGAENLYLSVGMKGPNGEPICDPALNYNVIVPQYSTYDCSNHRLRICGYAAGATGKAAVTIIRRRDVSK